jgi:ParB family transcriptional regulator, chromosome partitioning protein
MPKPPSLVTRFSKDVAEAQKGLKESTSKIPLEEIHDRDRDSRPLNMAHVEALAESIEAIGLIQPVVVDEEGSLLAGAHRKAAITLIKNRNPSAYEEHFDEGVPIRRYEFKASEEKELALAIEASENEKRRDYSALEVRELADRLIAAGYHHTKGRAKEGTKSLLPSLEIIVGKSRSQIKRYLAEDGNGAEKLNGSYEPFSQKCLRQAITALQKYQNAELRSTKEKRLLKNLPGILESLAEATD